MSKPDDFDPDEQIERERLLRWARRDASPYPLTELERAERDYYKPDWAGLWTNAIPTLAASLCSPWWLIAMPFITIALIGAGVFLSKLMALFFDPEGEAPLWCVAWGIGVANLLLGPIIYFYADVAWSQTLFLLGCVLGCILCVPAGVLCAHIRMSQPRPRYLQLLDEMRRDPPGIIE